MITNMLRWFAPTLGGIGGAPSRRSTARSARRAAPRVVGLEGRQLLTVGFSEFPVPTANARPYGITVGPGGDLWFTEQSADRIGVLDPGTHAVQDYAIPTTDLGPSRIVAGPDGNLWFTEFGLDQVGIFNPTTRSFVGHVAIGSSWGQGIAVGPDGAIWVTEPAGGAIVRIDPSSRATTTFSVPGDPEEITAGPDGNLYMTDDQLVTGGGSASNGILEFNTASHATASFPQPNGGDDSQGIVAGPDGNIWFTEVLVPLSGTTSDVATLNLTTHQITEFPLTERPHVLAPEAPNWIAVGPDGNLWFTDLTGGVGSINPTTHQISESTVNGSSFPTEIVAGPDGHLWFTDQNGDAIGEVLPDSTPGGGQGTNGSPSSLELTASQAVFTGKKARRHLVGFEFRFSEPLDPSRAADAANYVVSETIRAGAKRRTKTIRAVASYDASTQSVMLTLESRAAFAKGGTLTIEGRAPSGLEDTLGDYLDGAASGVPGTDATLSIARRGLRLQ